MSTEFEFEVTGKLNTTSLQNDLSNLKMNPIKIKVDLDGSSINRIKSQLESLSKINTAPQINSGLSKQITKIQNEFNILHNLSKEISKNKIDLAKLDDSKNESQIRALTQNLKNLQVEFAKTYQTMQKTTGISANEQKILNDEYAKTEKALTVIAAKKEDKRKADHAKQEINNAKEQLEIAEQLAKAEEKRRNEQAKADNKELKEQIKLEQDLANLRNQKDVFSTQMSTYLATNTALGKELVAEIQRILNAVDSVDDSQGLKNLKTQFTQVQLEAKAAGQTGKSFADQMKSNFTKLSSYVGVASISMTAMRSIKDMVSNVYEIDTAMTNLRKVTDETDAVYTAFLDKSAGKAQDLGMKISDLVTQSSEWAKLGYSLDQAFDLSSTSSIYANVGEVDNATAVADLVTIMKAYNIEATESMSIVDSLNKLGNEFAVSAGGIGEGLRKSASTLALAGNDLNQSIAMITGMAEITQDANTSGQALKILSMRIRGMRGELEALGEEYENIESVSKIQTQILNLTNGAVNIMDDLDPTKFKSTYEIMSQISDVWTTMAETDQADLLEILAGKQRGNSIAALLSSFQSGQVDSALTAAINSENSAMEEQEKYMQSLQAKVAQFQAAFQSLSQTIMSSDILKSFVDMGTGMINVLDAIIPRLNSLPKLLAAVAGGASLIKNAGAFKIGDDGIKLLGMSFDETKEKVQDLKDFMGNVFLGFDKIKPPEILNEKEAAEIFSSLSQAAIKGEGDLSAYFKTLDRNQSYIKEYALNTDAASRSTQGLIIASKNAQAAQIAKNTAIKATGVSAKVAAVSVKLLNAALNVGIMFLVSTAISAVVKGIQHLATANQRAIEKSNELAETFKENNRSLQSNSQWLSENKQRYLELAKGVDSFGNNLTLTDDEFREHGRLANNIANMFPELVTGYDKTGNAILNVTNKSIALTEAFEAQAKAARDAIIADGDNLLAGINTFSVNGRETPTGDRLLKFEEMIRRYKDDLASFDLKSLAEDGLITMSDFETLGYKRGQFESAQSFFDRIFEDITKFEGRVATLAATVNDNLSNVKTFTEAVLGNSSDFSDFDTDLQTSINQWLGAMDANFYKQFTNEKGKFQSNLLSDWIYSFVENVANNTEVQEAFTNLFSLQEQDLSSEEFEKLRDEYTAIIAEVTGMEPATLAVLLDILPPDVAAALADVEDKPIIVTVETSLKDEGFKSVLDKFKSETSTLQSALDEMANGTFDSSALLSLLEEFPQLATETDNLEDAIRNLMETSLDETLAKIDEQITKIKESGEDPTGLENIRDIIKDIGIEATSTETYLRRVSAQLQSQKDTLATAKSEQNSGLGISQETLDKLPTKYANAQEQTANGTILNPDKLKAIQNAEQAIIKSNFSKNRADLTKKLKENQSALSNLNKTFSDTAVRANKAAGIEMKISGIEDQLAQLNSLENQYNSVTSAYERWQDALNSPNEGDMYDSLFDGLEGAKEAYDAGLIGKDDFQAFAQLCTNIDLSTASIDEMVAAYEAGYPAMERYFTKGREGCEAFLEDLKNAEEGWVRLNENNEWEIDFGRHNDQEIADYLNINVESVQSVLRKLRDYGFVINLDQPNEELAQLYKNLEAAQKSLDLLDGENIDVDINGDSTNAKNAVNEAQLAIDEYLKLHPEIVLNVDNTDAVNAITTVYEYKAALDELSTMEIGVNASEAQFAVAKTKVDELAVLIDDFDHEIKTSLNIDGMTTEQIAEAISQDMITIPAELQELGTESLEGIKQIIEEIDGTTVTVGVDTSDGEANVANLKDFIQNIKDKIISVTANMQPVFDAINNFLTTPTTKTVTVNTVETSSGKSNVKGTAYHTGSAFLQGTTFKEIRRDYNNPYKNRAFVNGDWRVPQSTTALVGELGTELLVRDGQWHTIGENGAEFRDIKAGDIIFNHKQTESLFSRNNGGRGKAFASGTALSSGSGRFNIGGSGSQAYSDNSNSNSDMANATADATENFEEIVDWVEILRNTFKLATEKLVTYANDILDKFRDQNKVLNQAIAKSKERMTVEQRAYDRYMLQANAVSLSDTYKQKVQSGALDIETITDEDLRKRINDYKEWYDKAQDCATAINDIKIEIQSLATQKLDNIIDDMEKVSSYHEQVINTQRIYLQLNSSLGKRFNNATHKSMLQHQSDITKELESHLKSLTSEFNNLVNGGYITKFSDAWYDWSKQIESVNQQIAESTLALQGLYDIKRDYLVKELDNIVNYHKSAVSLQQSLINANSSKGTLSSEVDVMKMLQNQLSITSQSQKYLNQLYSEFNSLVKNGSIIEATDQWYEWKAQIDNVQKSIYDSSTAVKEFVNQIRGIRWNEFFGSQNLQNRQNSEINTLLSLFTNGSLLGDDGSFTNAGKSKFALLSQQLTSAKQTAEDYRVAIKNLDKELKNGVITQEEYNEYLNEYSAAQRKAVEDTNAARKAIISLIADGINKETDAYDKLIQKKKEEIRTSEDALAFNKKVADRQKNITDIQRKLNALANDDSHSALAERKRLQHELLNEQSSLNEIYHEKSISDQLKALDEENKNFKDANDERINLLESDLDAQSTAIAKYLEEIKDDYSNVYNYLNDLSDAYNFDLTTNLTSPWESASNAAQHYLDIINEITNSVANQVDTGKIDTITTSTTPSSSTSQSTNPPSNTTSDQNQKSVNDLYKKVLGRNADASGLAHWTKQLESGKSISDIEAALKNSDEYRQKQVNDLYKDVLGREADVSGLGYYSSLLKNGISLSVIESRLKESEEGRKNFLKSLYKGVLGRDIDTGGLDYHLGLMQKGTSRDDIISSVLRSTEFNSKYGKLSNTDFINTAYNTAFGRKADDGGFDYALNRLNSGISKADIFKSLISSTEFKNRFAGFKTGTKHVNKDQWAFMSEPEYGEEALITPHGLLTPLQKGDTILNHGATDNIYEFGNDPAKFLAGMIPNFTQPSSANMFNSNEANYNFAHSSTVNIHGNADEQIVRKISKEVFDNSFRSARKDLAQKGLK